MRVESHLYSRIFQSGGTDRCGRWMGCSRCQFLDFRWKSSSEGAVRVKVRSMKCRGCLFVRGGRAFYSCWIWIMSWYVMVQVEDDSCVRSDLKTGLYIPVRSRGWMRRGQMRRGQMRRGWMRSRGVYCQGPMIYVHGNELVLVCSCHLRTGTYSGGLIEEQEIILGLKEPRRDIYSHHLHTIHITSL